MAVVWTVEDHATSGAKRHVTIKRMVDGNEVTAQTLSHKFHFKDTKIQIKAKFKELYLAEKAKRVELNAVLKDADLSGFEVEVNA